MNAVRLLQHFDRISEAPGAIPRLRRFILDLAVRGKLVEQDPKDEPATELLKRIQAEKARLAKEEKIKQEKPIQSRTNGSMPIELPKGWLWGCIQEICTSVTDGDHIPPPKSESGIPFLVIGNVRSQSIDFGSCRYVPDAYYQQLDEIRRPTKGDVLYTLVGSYGIPVVVKDDRPFCVQRHIGILRPSRYVNVDCLARILESRVVFDQATRYATGIAQKTVPLAGLRGILIPLPPLAEQHRIVAKVDELMALCDQLEATKTKREQSRDRLVAASLHCLNSPADTAETDAPDLPAQQADAFRDHARFVFNHLPRLTTRPEHIKQLRQTILNLAVSGKLVSQDPNDEPAAELLKRIQAEKARLVKEGKISRENLRIPTGDNELAFELKPGWQATRISQILVELQTGPFGSSLHQSDYQKGGIPVINPASIKNERLIPIDGMAVGQATLERLATFKLRTGDIVMGRRGEMGRCAIVTEHESGWLCGTGSLILRLPECVFPRFFVTLIGSPFVREYLGGSAVGATMQNLNQSILLNLVIGLPPLAEQHRIVARVDELMALCDQLEAQLIATEADSRRLLEAVLHEALNQPLTATEQMRLEANI